MVAAILVYGLAAASLVPTFGNPGLWAAMLVFLAARGLFLALVYRRAGFGASFAGGAAPG
jgi:MATE family multidrug resistance protein